VRDQLQTFAIAAPATLAQQVTPAGAGPNDDQAGPPQRWQLETDAPRAYERYLVPALFAPWAERLLDLAAVGPGERVLDVAGGRRRCPALPGQRL
jgi:hypothetical protein